MKKIVIETTAVVQNKKLAQGYHVMTLAPFSRLKSIKPGQFVHIKIPNCNLMFRRAFSVYDVDTKKGQLDIIFKVFGRGTALLSRFKAGQELSLMGPLGNHFTFPSRKEFALMVAGGIGMPPVYFLAKSLVERGHDKKRIVFFYGGNGRADLVDLARIKRLGIKVIPATLDGTVGFRGLVTEAVLAYLVDLGGSARIYACGPEGMLKAVDELAREQDIPGELSLEAPMPCGVGICLGCIKPLKAGGYTRVCHDGPVYKVGEVLL